MELEKRKRGSGADIIVLDKTGVGAGASGIACGCVRNLYMTEPLHAILRHSVDVWSYDPVAFGFQQVGYVGAAEGKEQAEYERVHASQNAAGYPSDLYVGPGRQALPQESVARLHAPTTWTSPCTRRVSGYAGTRQAVNGLAQKCADHGVRILTGVEVTGYDVVGGQVKGVHTNRGDIKCDLVIWGLGAWTPKHWHDARARGRRVDCRYPDGGTQTQGHVDLLAPARRRGLRRPALSDRGRPEPAGAAHRDLRAGGRQGNRQRARRLSVRLFQEWQRAHGPARPAGRHGADQDRPGWP